jgi:hypothetical protein
VRVFYTPTLPTFTSNFHRHLVHASDADQLEAILTRWGPDGVGKLGGQGSSAAHLFYFNVDSQIHAGRTPLRTEFDKAIKRELSMRLSMPSIHLKEATSMSPCEDSFALSTV